MTAFSWGLQDGLVSSKASLRVAFNSTAQTSYMETESGKKGQSPLCRNLSGFSFATFADVLLAKAGLSLE